MALVELSSSFREVEPESAYERASRVARELGITRVTDITRLDRIGVPVCIAVRPDALPGSLCVNAGKGLALAEARVGAIMEAIEYAWAEPRRAGLAPVLGRLRDVLDGAAHACLDLCPVLDQTLDLDAEIELVAVADLATGAPTMVPAELVLHPLPQQRGRQFFGTNTNGLASGMTVEEATLHGLAELIERDVLAFHRVFPSSRRIRLGSLPPRLAELAGAIRAARFDLHVRAIDNPFGLPCIAALVTDPDQWRMTMRGEGCHLSSSIAAVRAITESIQARLSLIHGGRDDLVNIWARQHGRSEDEIEARYRDAIAHFAGGDEIAFADVVDRAGEVASIPEAIALLVRALADAGLPTVLRHVYTPPNYPVQVVRVIVPGLENYTHELRRVGPRLKAYAAQHRRPL